MAHQVETVTNGKRDVIMYVQHITRASSKLVTTYASVVHIYGVMGGRGVNIKFNAKLLHVLYDRGGCCIVSPWATLYLLMQNSVVMEIV